ncbi:putative T-complex protein [Chloropicon roscoffensis]|uniref:T-complex protein n=2 Tax=Chloropicon roscoffensis TaxID=1461544 RepID=A0AAX4PMA9_9CHLO
MVEDGEVEAGVVTEPASPAMAAGPGGDTFDDTPVKTLGRELTFEELIEQQLRLEETNSIARGPSAGGEAAKRKKFKFLRKGERDWETRRSAEKGKRSAQTRRVEHRQAVGPSRPAAASGRKKGAEVERQEGEGPVEKVMVDAQALSPSQSKYVQQFYGDYYEDDDEGGSEGSEGGDYGGYARAARRGGPSASGSADEGDNDEGFVSVKHQVRRTYQSAFSQGDDEEDVDSIDVEDDDHDSMDEEEEEGGGGGGERMRGHMSAERRQRWARVREEEERELREFELLERQVEAELAGAEASGPAMTASIPAPSYEDGMPSLLQQASFAGKPFSETMRGISLVTAFEDTERWEDEGAEDEEAATVDDDDAGEVGYAAQHARSIEGTRAGEPRRSRESAVKASAAKRVSREKPPPAAVEVEEEQAAGRAMSAVEQRHVRLLEQEIKKMVEERKRYKRLAQDVKKRAAALDVAEAEFDRRREAEIENIRVMKEKAEKKIKRDRRVLDQQSRTLLSKIPNKKDREEIQQLQELLEKERQQQKRKERAHRMNEDRLRRQVAELQRRAEELKDEVRRLERRQLEQLEAKKAAAGAAMADAAAPATASRQAARAPAREEETRRREEPAAAAAAAAAKPTGKADNGGGGSSKPSKVTYPNGTQKRNFPNGDVVIHFNNGDVKKTKGTTTEYYYAEVDTWHTTHNNGIEVFHFPSGQIEAHFPNGAKEVLFPDGVAHRLTDPEGDEHQLIDAGELCEVFHRPKPQLTVSA